MTGKDIKDLYQKLHTLFHRLET